jgi:hypothetical protein
MISELFQSVSSGDSSSQLLSCNYVEAAEETGGLIFALLITGVDGNYGSCKTLSRFKKIDDYFYADDGGNIYFCVSDFLQTNNLPDEPAMRRVVIEDLRAIAPDMPIMEEATTGEVFACFLPQRQRRKHQ